MITLGVVVERLSGKSLDQVVAERITGPLGMKDTGYNPTDRTRTAATEYQTAPARGMVWGEVHDENAWSLGGVAGHAGVFSTADDLAVLSQTLLNGGTYRGHRILSRASVSSLITNFNGDFPGDAHGLGLRARPAVVHGRPLRAAHRRPHRVHRHVDRHRLRVALVRDPAHQPGAPLAQLGQQQPGPARVGRRPGPGDARAAEAR